jgi:hypothetical protein
MSLKIHHCCDAFRPKSFGRGVAAAKWIAPSAILALLPKCPLCVVAYVALITGVGISVTTATYLRYGLLFFCIGALSFMAAKYLRRIFTWSHGRL